MLWLWQLNQNDVSLAQAQASPAPTVDNILLIGCCHSSGGSRAYNWGTLTLNKVSNLRTDCLS
jgi:hypothetical protein